jgi:hypothetical protein
MKESTMRTSTVAVGVLVTSAAVVGGAVTANADSSVAQPKGSHTIVFATPWTGGEQTYLDLGSPGQGSGDVFLIADLPVLVRGQRVGSLEGTETILSDAHDGTVSQQVTVRLPDGNVMLEGVGRHDDSPFRLAVVGGTGAFNRARGEMVVVGEDEPNKQNIQKLVVLP